MHNTLILHHYPESPFAEKARLMLGFKQLSWGSVYIPRIMPKPDLTALTGGYRKTPVLQVGADIYCDTALIARRLEAEKATPTLFPEGQECVVAAFAQWADSLVFQTAITLSFQPDALAARMAQFPPAAVQAFLADRAALFKGGSAPRLSAEQARSTWTVLMARLEQQLARESDDFLFGAPSVADFAMAHPLWFLKNGPATASLVESSPQISAWLARVLDFGHGSAQRMEAEQALEIARQAEPAPLPAEAFTDPNGFQPGQRVTIRAVDYGVDPVEGELLYAGRDELILRREDERAGLVHVHFPRLGFQIEAL
jgi:glutathione S-transferase